MVTTINEATHPCKRLRIVVASSSSDGFLERLLSDRLIRSKYIIAAVLFPWDQVVLRETAARHSVASHALFCSWRHSPSPLRSHEFFRHCDRMKADVVLLGHFLRHLRPPVHYRGRVLSSHGSLLPAFGGKGMYGLRLQREILSSNARVTGCTVHIVTDQYDEGEILSQRIVRIEDGESPVELLHRVSALEVEALADALETCAARLAANGSPSNDDQPDSGML